MATVLGILALVVAYLVGAGLIWLLQYYMDFGFTGEGDGHLSKADRRLRLLVSLGWLPVLTYAWYESSRDTSLAASGR